MIISQMRLGWGCGRRGLRRAPAVGGGAPPRTHAALGHQHAQGSSPGWGGEQQQKLADLRRELAASKREAALAQERQASFGPLHISPGTVRNPNPKPILWRGGSMSDHEV